VLKVKRLRIVVQVLAFVLLIYGGRLGLNKDIFKSENLRYIGDMLPTFSCPYVSGRVGGCYLMPLQRVLYDTTIEEYLKTWGWPVIKGFFFFFLLYILLGRMWCGWICPLGSFFDFLSMLRSFFGINHFKFPRKVHLELKAVKYIVLMVMFFISLFMAHSFLGLGKISPDFKLPFCQLCPAKPLLPFLEGDISHLTIITITNKTLFMSVLAMVILTFFMVGSFFQRRFFCRFCPMLALMNVFGNLSLFQFRKNPQTCTHCENCAYVCPMDIRKVSEEREKSKVLDDDCILCLSCIEACPEDNTLFFRFFNLSILKSLRKRVEKR